jgi:superfamily II RNA helicase
VGADALKDIIKDYATELAEEAALSKLIDERQTLANDIKAEEKKKCPDKQRLAALRKAFKAMDTAVKKLYTEIGKLRTSVNRATADYAQRMGLYMPGVNVVPFENGLIPVPTPDT